MIDLDFFRVQEGDSEQKSFIPIKKEKGCELTPKTKRIQQKPSAKRIVIENMAFVDQKITE